MQRETKDSSAKFMYFMQSAYHQARSFFNRNSMVCSRQKHGGEDGAGYAGSQNEQISFGSCYTCRIVPSGTKTKRAAAEKIVEDCMEGDVIPQKNRYMCSFWRSTKMTGTTTGPNSA